MSLLKSHALILVVASVVVTTMYGLGALPAMLAGYLALLGGQALVLWLLDIWLGIEDEGGGQG